MSFFPNYFRLSPRSKRVYRFEVDGFLGSPGFAGSVQQVVGSNSSRFMFQDFENASAGNMSPFVNTLVNTGTFADTAAFVDHITKAVGVAAIGTGTVSAAGTSSLTTSLACVTLGNRPLAFEARLSGSTSTVAQEYSICVGFGGNLRIATLNAVNCAYFRYARGIDGAKWACITAKDSDADPTAPTNTTKVVTTVDFDPNDMHVFRIECTVAGVVTFFIDGVQVAQISTNVPTDPAGFAHQVGVGCRALKSAGTGTARTAFIDYMGLAAA